MIVRNNHQRETLLSLLLSLLIFYLCMAIQCCFVFLNPEHHLGEKRDYSNNANSFEPYLYIQMSCLIHSLFRCSSLSLLFNSYYLLDKFWEKQYLLVFWRLFILQFKLILSFPFWQRKKEKAIHARQINEIYARELWIKNTSTIQLDSFCSVSQIYFFSCLILLNAHARIYFLPLIITSYLTERIHKNTLISMHLVKRAKHQ